MFKCFYCVGFEPVTFSAVGEYSPTIPNTGQVKQKSPESNSHITIATYAVIRALFSEVYRPL
jgi:hypothetical protein